jgi:hypothetical protein
MKTTQISRRNFSTLALGMAVAAALVAVGNTQAADGSPNFVIILSDDQGWPGPVLAAPFRANVK